MSGESRVSLAHAIYFVYALPTDPRVHDQQPQVTCRLGIFPQHLPHLCTMNCMADETYNMQDYGEDTC